ncbi:hypothetical protein GCM10027359_17810 [Marilutibacter aestuarii]
MGVAFQAMARNNAGPDRLSATHATSSSADPACAPLVSSPCGAWELLGVVPSHVDRKGRTGAAPGYRAAFAHFRVSASISRKSSGSSDLKLKQDLPCILFRS